MLAIFYLVTCISSTLVIAKKKPQGGTLVVACEHSEGWTRNFNPFYQKSLYSVDMIFERLVLYNIMQKGKAVPRLATKYQYAKDMKSITYTLRKGVRWSDGKEFDANDVIFTFELIRKFKALDGSGLADKIKSVIKLDPFRVQFNLNQVDVSVEWLIGQVPIVPRHQWHRVKDPVNFLNPNPIGTGPYTQVSTFSFRSYTLCRNSKYWEKGKPYIDCLKFPALSGNEQIQAELIQGKIDWAGIFIPDIEKVYVSKNPKHFHYWFPPNNNISLYMNTEKPPFNDLAFRRALSMSIDRDRIVEMATYGYAIVSKYPTGLGDLYKDWYDEEVNHSVGKLGTYAPLETRRILTHAGYRDRDRDGFRENPDGSPLFFKIFVVKGWTDWEMSVRMIVEYLEEIGIRAVKHSLGFQEWLDHMKRGDYEVAIAWGDVGQSPWQYYYSLLSSRLKKAKAESTSWSPWSSKEADQLLREYTKTTDFAQHKKIIGKLQRIVAENVPIIPLFSNPSWYEYNDSRFIGWATAENPFVRPMCFRDVKERILHVLNLSLRSKMSVP